MRSWKRFIETRIHRCRTLPLWPRRLIRYANIAADEHGAVTVTHTLRVQSQGAQTRSGRSPGGDKCRRHEAAGARTGGAHSDEVALASERNAASAELHSARAELHCVSAETPRADAAVRVRESIKSTAVP